MNYTLEQLYQLLPSYHRERDTRIGSEALSDIEKKLIGQLQNRLSGLIDKEGAEALYLRKKIDEIQRGPLKAILSLIAEQIEMLGENLDQLYDDQFIETCADWVVPYIGELIGTRGLLDYPDMPFSQRAQVANTIAYRRRKGTAAVVEQLARDVTGWPANVVEYFKLLATTQYMNHLRPESTVTANLRKSEGLEYLHTPFDPVSRSVDIRSIESKKGKYNLPNIGVFLWRHTSFSLTQSQAFKVDDRRYTFNALGLDTPLYNLPVAEKYITQLAKPENVPHPLSRSILMDHLEDHYGKGKALLVYKDGSEVEPNGSQSLADLISICDLSDKKNNAGVVIGWNNLPQNKIAIDPVLGRLAFPSAEPAPNKVEVTYHYGAIAEIGGGEYGRTASFHTNNDTRVRVPTDKSTIQDAINSLSSEGGVVEIEDNARYHEKIEINVPSEKRIEIRAANLRRPALILNGNAVVTGGSHSGFTINGVLIAGGTIDVPEKINSHTDNKLHELSIDHATVLSMPLPEIQSSPPAPGQPAIVVECNETTLAIDKSITGSLQVVDTSEIQISESIVDAGEVSGTAISGPGGNDPSGQLTAERVTIIGKVRTRMMELVTNSIIKAERATGDTWEAPVIADRVQQGCIRFSYIPPGSKTPSPYQCVPANQENDSFVQPVFESLQYNDKSYCQLSEKTSEKITEGAEDYSEMGVFHDLYQPQRIKNLQNRIREYLKFGLEEGVFLV